MKHAIIAGLVFMTSITVSQADQYTYYCKDTRSILDPDLGKYYKLETRPVYVTIDTVSKIRSSLNHSIVQSRGKILIAVNIGIAFMSILAIRIIPGPDIHNSRDEEHCSVVNHIIN